MDTKALRQKILDLATRGKLVPQDPNDEPASVLLERIRAEKQQMVKDGKLKPKDIKNDTIIFVGEDNLHYEKFQDGTVKCIEDEIPFDVPEGWEWTRLGFLGQYKKGPFGSSITKAMFIPDSLTAIKIYEQKNAICKDASLGNYFISKDKYETLKGFEVFPNDIIVSCAGTIGESYVLPSNMRKGIINQALMKITLFDLRLLDFYLMYFDFKLKESAQEHGHGIALKNIPPFDVLKQYLIPIPPIEEQKKIIKSINSLLEMVDLIDSNSNEVAELINFTKSKILDLAIRGKLVPQDPNDEPASVLLERIRTEKEELIKAGKIKRDKKESIIFRGEDNSYYEKVGKVIKNIDNEIPFTIPDSWKWCRLKTICKKIVDGSHNPPKGLDFVTPYIMASSRNIIENTISDLSNVRYLNKENFIKEHSRTNVKINDILLTTVATLGRSCIYKGKPENLCFQRSVTVITSCILPTYLKLFFDAPYFQNIIVKSATGTAQKGFYLNQLENVLICIPPLAEQDKISCGISSIFYYLDLIEKSLN